MEIPRVPESVGKAPYGVATCEERSKYLVTAGLYRFGISIFLNLHAEIYWDRNMGRHAISILRLASLLEVYCHKVYIWHQCQHTLCSTLAFVVNVPYRI